MANDESMPKKQSHAAVGSSLHIILFVQSRILSHGWNEAPTKCSRASRRDDTSTAVLSEWNAAIRRSVHDFEISR